MDEEVVLCNFDKPEKKETVRWRCMFTNTILDVLEQKAGWVPASSQRDWDFLWCGKDWMNNNFDRHKFEGRQKVSHFRNDYELTKKDNLVRNIKKMCRQLNKDGKYDEAKKYDFLPASYVLPDYHLFVEEFRQHPSDTLWIMKPVAGAQGRGIFLFRKLKDITEWRKFQPLRAWVHRDGFVRFSHSKYNMSSIEDAYIHLTNVAIAKTAPDYDPDRGLKWPFCKFRRFMSAKHGQGVLLKLLEDIGWVLIRSLQAVQRQLIQDRHCFELYGYDILLDDKLKPWLLEVNASPSLTASSKEDYDMKYNVLNDTLDAVDPLDKLTGKEVQIGGLDILINGNTVVSFTLANRPLEEIKVYKSRLNVHLGAPYEPYSSTRGKVW